MDLKLSERRIAHGGLRLLLSHRVAALKHYRCVLPELTLTIRDVLQKLAVEALMNNSVALFLALNAVFILAWGLFAVLLVHLTSVVACYGTVSSVLALINVLWTP